jgi:hypothetical protein
MIIFLLILFLSACSDDFTLTQDASSRTLAIGIDAESEESDVSLDASLNAETAPDVIQESSMFDASDGFSCNAADASCSLGTCCGGLHCVSGSCQACKPNGYIAASAFECCNPQTFSGSSCGDVSLKCGIPNQSGCSMTSTCCQGSSCKFQGQYWQCSCGDVDTPCTLGGQCCSQKCTMGWCES